MLIMTNLFYQKTTPSLPFFPAISVAHLRHPATLPTHLWRICDGGHERWELSDQ
jgi:hypothetical protein